MRTQLLAAGAFAALALASCTSKKANQFTLTGENLTDLNGTYAYIYEPGSRKAIDSVLIQEGAFTKTFPASIVTYNIIKLTKKEMIRFIPEAGSAKIVADEAEGYKLVPADTLGLNAQMLAFYAESERTLKPIQEAYRQKITEYSQKKEAGFDKDEERLALEAQLDSIGASYDAANDEIANRYYSANAQNVLGALTFSSLTFQNDSDFAARYEAASDAVKNDAQLQKRYNTIKTAEKTQAGMPYADFTIDNGQGQISKLSDYMDGKRYLLVDFWASWCGPCRNAMPHLAKIASDHAKTIRVLSVGVWEESIEDNQKAIEELKMTWDTVFDKESVGPETYGVEGIPTLLFIAPDGTIAVRTHSPEDINAKIKELGL